jgi:diguanylate cyclase (GGDEF)-like protein
VKAGGQFVIVAATTPADRDKLFAGALAHAAQEQARVVTRPPRPRPVKAEAKQPPAPEKPATKIETVRAELESARQDFYELALVDSLTGLYNRRHFVKRLKEELREAERYQRSPALLLLDIDDFTAINEQFGLHAGDEILRSVGEVIQGVLRKVDIIGRLGGDEFGALLLETTPQSSLLAAHRLQKHLSGVAIEVDERLFHIKVSIALVHVGDDKAVSADKLLRQAEKLLQQAKESGGNLVIQA